MSASSPDPESRLIKTTLNSHKENKLMVTKRERGGDGVRAGEWIKLEFGINRYILLYIKEITRTYCIAQGNIFNIL